MLNKEIHLTSRPDGLPKQDDFTLVETEVNKTADDVLVQNLYMSVDPAMRPALSNGQMKLGEVMVGGAIGRVVESSNSAFPQDALVIHRSGFREYHTSDGRDLRMRVSR